MQNPKSDWIFELLKINEISIIDTKIKNFNIYKDFEILKINENSNTKNYNKFYGKNEINDNSKLEIGKNLKLNENFLIYQETLKLIKIQKF